MLGPNPQGSEYERLRSEEARVVEILKDYEKKIALEQKLKTSAETMSKVHSDKKAKKQAEEQALAAERKLQILNMECASYSSQYRQISERLQFILQSENSLLKGEAPPPVPDRPVHEPRLSDSQKNTFELYQQPKRSSVTVHGGQPSPGGTSSVPGSPGSQRPTSLLGRFGLQRSSSSSTVLSVAPQAHPAQAPPPQNPYASPYPAPYPPAVPPRSPYPGMPHPPAVSSPMMYPSVTHPYSPSPQMNQQPYPHAYPSSPAHAHPVPPNPYPSTSAPPQPLPPQIYPQSPQNPRPMVPGPLPEDPWQKLRTQKEELDRKDAEITHLTSLLAEVEQHLRSKPTDASPQKDTSGDQINELASQLIAVSEQKEMVETRLVEAERTIENIRRQENDIVGPLEAKIATLIEEKNRYQAEIAVLKESGVPTEHQSDASVSDVDSLRRQNVNAQEKLQVVESRLNTARREAAEASKRNEYLEGQLRQQGVDGSHFEAVKLVSQYQVKAEMLEAQVEELQTRCRDLESNRTSSPDKTVTLSPPPTFGANSDIIQSLQTQLIAVENTLLATKEASEKKRSALSHRLEETQHNLDVALSEQGALRKELGAKVAQLEELRNRDLVVPYDNHLESRIAELERETVLLRQEKEECAKDMESLKQEVVEGHEKAAQLQEEKARYLSQLATVQEGVEEKVSTLVKENEEYMARVVQLEQVVAEGNERCEILERERGEAGATIKDIERAIEEGQDKVTCLEREKAEHAATIAKLNEDLERGVEERERSLRMEIGEIEERYRAVEQELRSTIDSLRREADEKYSERERNVAVYEARIAEDESARQTLLAALKQLEDSVETARREASDVGGELAKETEIRTALEKKCEDFSRDLTAANGRIAELEGLCFEADEQSKVLADTIGQLEAELGIAHAKLRDSEEEIGLLRVGLDNGKRDFEERLGLLEGDQKAVQERANAAEVAKKELEDYVRNLEDDIAGLRAQIKSLSEEKQTSMVQYQSSQTELANLKSELERKNLEVNNLTSRIQNLEAALNQSQTERDKASERCRQVLESGDAASAKEEALRSELEALRTQYMAEVKNVRGFEEAEAKARERTRALEEEIKGVQTARVGELDLMREVERRLEGLKLEFSEKDVALKERDARVSDLENSLRGREAEVKKLEETLYRSRKQLELSQGSQSSLEAERAKWEAERRELAARLTQLETSEERQDALRRELESLKAEGANVAAERDILLREREDRCRTLESNISEVRNELEVVRKEALTAQSQHQKACADVEDLTKQLEEANTKLAIMASTPVPEPASVTAAPVTNDEQLQEMIARNMTLNIDLADRDQQLQELRNKLRKEAEERNSLIARLEELEKTPNHKSGWW